MPGQDRPRGRRAPAPFHGTEGLPAQRVHRGAPPTSLSLLLLALALVLLFPSLSSGVPGPHGVLPLPASPSPPASAAVPQRASHLPVTGAAPQEGPLAPARHVGTSPSPPVVGWVTPRGPSSENGSSVGFAPEVDWVTGLPQVLGTAALGPEGPNLTGIAVAPGGPVLVALRNGTLAAYSEGALAPLWLSEVHEPLVGGPSIVGNDAFAVGASGRLYGWDLGSGTVVENLSLGAPSLGAAPIPYHGELYLLTSSNLTVVNATTGGVDVIARNFSADPTHALALGDGYLYAQGNSALEAFTPFGTWHNATADLLSHQGAVLYSDGLVAVAGPLETLVGGLPGTHQWTVSPLHAGTAPLMPAAASNGRIFATDGQGPLYALSESSNTVLWTTSFPVTGPPTAVGGQVYVGANVTGIGNGLADLNASTGRLLWFHALGAAVNTTVAVADGALYAVDERGNLTSLGSPPLGLLLQANRTGAAAGASFNFTSTVLGGAGAPTTVAWTFSDGSTAVGSFSDHTFTAPGPAWASATVSDAEGTWAGPVNLSVTVYPAFATGLRLDHDIGGAPLWVNATALPTGGSGGYSIVFQVVGAQPGSYAPPVPTQTLRFTVAGNDYVSVVVTDSAGDVARSVPALVIVNPASFPPPALTLVAPSAGSLQVLWSAPPTPGFQAWVVNLSIDGGAPGTLGRLTDPNASSFLFTGLAMDSHLVVEVTRSTSFGNFSSSANYTTPLLAPPLGVAEASGLPGQADLTWTLTTPIDGTASWSVNETLPGATSSITLRPSAPVNGLYQILSAPLPDLETTTFQLAVNTSDQHASGASVPFAPIVAAPTVQTTAVPLGVEVAWNALSFPDFASVLLCYGAPAGGLGSEVWTCPLTNDSPVGAVSMPVPSSGTYDVNLTVRASNGFSVATAPIAVAIPGHPAATIWYATPLMDVPFWFWALFVLTLVALLLVGLKLHRERRRIPPYTEEVMPWDPLSSDPEPRARPRDPDTLRSSSKIHRHRSSHTHRHPSGGDEAEEEEGGEGEAPPAPRLKRPSTTGAAPATSRRGGGGGGAEAEMGEDASGEIQFTDRGADRSSHRTASRSPSDRAVKIDEVGDEPSSPEAVDGEGSTEAELRKLPVVLRHRETEGSGGREDEREEVSPTPRSPPSRRSASSTAGRAKDGEDEDDEEDEGPGGEEGALKGARPRSSPPPPRRPAPRPKPENEEPTL